MSKIDSESSNLHGGKCQEHDRKLAGSREAMTLIEDALRDLKYGHVTVTVQDGVIVLVERTEKRRVV